MKLLTVGDLHEEFTYLDKIPEVVENAGIDAVLFTGNILKAEARHQEWQRAEREHREPDMNRTGIVVERAKDLESLKRFFHTLSQLNRPVYIIPGKNDAPERHFLQAAFNREIITPNIFMVHRSFAPLGRSFVVAGFGGEITNEIRENEAFLMYPGWEVEFSLDFIRHLDQDKILLFHTPPAEQTRGQEAAESHDVVSSIIKTYDPAFVVSSRGDNPRGKFVVGNTLIVSPGPLKDGYYAILDTRERAVDLGDLR